MKRTYTPPVIVLNNIILEHSVTATSIAGGGNEAYQVEIEDWSDGNENDINGNIFVL